MSKPKLNIFSVSLNPRDKIINFEIFLISLDKKIVKDVQHIKKIFLNKF
jgi:hypothetical protein